MPLSRLELETSWGQLTVAGGSRAGEGTVILLPQLRLALDPGRPHRALPPMATAFVSHGHLDHLGALAYWASQRYLNGMGPGRVVVPREIAPGVSELLELHARLEGGRPYQVEVTGVEEGETLPLRRDMELGFFTTDHWVPTLGLELTWLHRRLRPELAGLPGDEIRRLRESGVEVSRTEPRRLLAYTADTGPRLLRRRPDLLEAEVLLVECTFFRPSDRERAARYGHLHLEDLLDVLPLLRCRHLVLLHASRRHRLREFERLLAQRLRPALAGGLLLHHLVVDWE